MKKLLTLLLVATIFSACGENVEEKASSKLQLAAEAFAANNFNEAKIQIDSIKILYPKAINARKEGIKLLQQVELKEQQQSLAYLDSMLTEKQAGFEAIKGKFTLEKNEEYQEVGNYFWPTQIVEKNLHRAYLRFQVNELGKMLMTSIYCGKNSIHHTAVKVSIADGTFAETPPSKDIYETTDLDEKIEKADYPIGEDGNVMGFIYLNNDKNIRVEYLGDKKFNTNMTKADKEALVNIYELAQFLSAIEQIKTEQKEALLKIRFIEERMSKNE
ncbi:hypothetical protein D0T50_02960 [Bacteroides sp. 214]|uniref:hypothetical protein n=1 Tax=Bacteroides sp. 214 TaxID=2302935 RepID=UPI0013D2FE3D|nr:hypothetical protein [Bacteroides sp. 214]NDW11847.1 hypothetical protein [Bacteroides sp. 214]